MHHYRGSVHHLEKEYDFDSMVGNLIVVVAIVGFVEGIAGFVKGIAGFEEGIAGFEEGIAGFEEFPVAVMYQVLHFAGFEFLVQFVALYQLEYFQ